MHEQAPDGWDNRLVVEDKPIPIFHAQVRFYNYTKNTISVTYIQVHSVSMHGTVPWCNCASHNNTIVFVLVDDWGYADVGFRNPAIKSPNFDEAAVGLNLNMSVL